MSENIKNILKVYGGPHALAEYERELEARKPPRGRHKAQEALVAELRELFTRYKPKGTWFVCVRDHGVVVVRSPIPISTEVEEGYQEL